MKVTEVRYEERRPDPDQPEAIRMIAGAGGDVGELPPELRQQDSSDRVPFVTAGAGGSVTAQDCTFISGGGYRTCSVTVALEPDDEGPWKALQLAESLVRARLDDGGGQ